MSKTIKAILLFLIILVALRFFSIRVAGDLIGIKLPTAIMFLLTTFSLQYFFKFNKGFVVAIQLLSFAYLFSILISLLIWDQSIVDSIRSTATLAVFPLFFLFLQFDLKIKTIEQVILIFGFVYFALNSYQLLFPQQAYFGYALGATEGEYANDSRGIVRIIFPGAGVFWLAVFIAISKITATAKAKWYYISLTLMGLIVPILQVTRQLVAFIVVIYTFHFGTQLSLAKKILFIAFFIGTSIYVLSLDLPFIKALEETTRRDTELGSDYIRVIAGKHYLFEFSDNPITQIFGNGFPNAKSSYGYATMKLETEGIWLEDVGIIGLYSQAGLLAVIGWFIIFYKSFTVKLPKEYYYCKYYLWMILATSLTSGSIYNIHFAVTHVIVIYVFHVISQDKKQNKLMKLLNLLKTKNISISDINKNKQTSTY
jgi:hypothetical protein